MFLLPLHWCTCWESQCSPVLWKPCHIATSVKEFPLLNLLRNKRLTEKVNCKSFQFRKWDLFNSIFKEIYCQSVPGIKMENLTPLTISCHCITVSIAWILSIPTLNFKVRKPLYSYASGLVLCSFLSSAAPRFLAEEFLERQHCGLLQVLPFPMEHHAIKSWTGEFWTTPIIQNSSNLLPFMSLHKTQLLQALVKKQTSLVWLLLAMQLNKDAIRALARTNTVPLEAHK